jgi:hypothetical protein
VTEEETTAVGVTEPPSAASDEEYVRGYAEGYREGIWESLREVLGHIARGYSASELRILVEGRLARLDDEVDVKRRSLLSPPKRRTWSARFFPVSSAHGTPVGPVAEPPVAPTPPPGASLETALSDWSAGKSYLFREERPVTASRFALAVADRYPTVVWVSLTTPPPTGLNAERVKLVRPAPRLAAGSGPGGDPGAVAGRIHEATEAKGGALVFVDALAFFGSEYGLEMTWKFVHWLIADAQSTGSTLVVSHDPKTWSTADVHQLQRAFHISV